MNAKGFAYLCFVAAVMCAAMAAGGIRAAPTGSLANTNAPFNPANATTTPGYYSVVRVIDGDTVIVWKNDEDTTVRLLGMDTPETVDPRKPVECFGPQASAEGKHLLTDTDVRLVPDPSQDEYDQYGRMLAYLYLPDGTFYNEFMIANGYAHEYTFKKAYQFQKQFKAAQASAKVAQLGLWSPTTCNGNTGVNSATTSATH
jgi:micrococcal nuclease